MRWIALAALTLACGSSGTRYVEAPDQDDTEIRAEAHEAWASAGVEAPATYTLLFLAPDALLDACNAAAPTGGYIGGCSFPGVVLLNVEAPFESQLQNLTHELGHVMRPHEKADELDLTHLDCPESLRGEYGTDVMCATGAIPGTWPTARDAAFVTR